MSTKRNSTHSAFLVSSDFRKALAAVEAWKHPIGTPVIVQKDNDEEVRTVTTSMAETLGSRAVIWLHGIRGCYALERVRVDTEALAAGAQAAPTLPSDVAPAAQGAGSGLPTLFQPPPVGFAVSAAAPTFTEGSLSARLHPVYAKLHNVRRLLEAAQAELTALGAVEGLVEGTPASFMVEQVPAVAAALGAQVAVLKVGESCTRATVAARLGEAGGLDALVEAQPGGWKWGGWKRTATASGWTAWRMKADSQKESVTSTSAAGLLAAIRTATPGEGQ